MQHHHHIDEFSVTDVRHTLQEIRRILVARRWFLLFPFCIVSTIACIASLYVPRQYSASTVIKREHDPVFASLKTKSWIQPYEEIRRRMATDIAEQKFIAGVLERAKLPVGAERGTDGSITQTADTVREQLASQISSGLGVKVLEASEHRDVVRISLSMSDPSRIPDILRLLRESYMDYARKKTIAILENVRKFLKTEAGRCAEEIAILNDRMAEMELKYPGVNPEETDTNDAERTALVIERVDVRRRFDDATVRKGRLEAQIAEIKRKKGSENEAGPELREQPNPRYAELLTEIKGLEEKIILCRTRRGMTEAHPELRSTRALLEERGAELAMTPRTVMTTEQNVESRADELHALDSLNAQLAETEATILALNARAQIVETRLREIDSLRLLSMENRPRFSELADKKKRLEADLGEWRKDIAPIENVLYLEGQGRSIHFATVQEPTSAIKPVAPDSSLVLLICFGIGGAAAVVVVIIVELCDRSYRTVKQLTTSLGVPVIESIDEIITAAAQRRRLIRGLVLMPIVGILLVVAVSIAGTMAYFSLEKPEEYASLKSPGAWAGRILGSRG